MADPFDWLQQLLGGDAPGMAMLRRVGAGADYMDDPGGAPTTLPRGDNRDQHWLAPGQPGGLSSAAGPFAGRGTFLHPNELGIYGWQGRTIPPGDEVIRPGDERAFAAPYMPTASPYEYTRNDNWTEILRKYGLLPPVAGGDLMGGDSK